MYVISGIYSGRKLVSKDDKDLRPTSGRTKEAVFNMLTHGDFSFEGGHALSGARVADICCGCGALGIEALSRGAAHVTFLDSSRVHLDTAARNIASLNDENVSADFVTGDCRTPPPARAPYQVIFLDPPYGKDMHNPALKALARSGWAADGTIAVIETDKKDEPAPEAPWHIVKERVYGKSRITIAVFGAAHGADEEE